MRRTRDFDAELKVLGDKVRGLKARKIEQLGALVVATGADALDLEVIAGLLRHGVIEAKVSAVKERWRQDGAMFLGRRGREGNVAAGSDGSGAGTQRGGDAPR